MARTIFSNIREEISKNIIQATDEILVAVAWFTDDVLFDLLKEALNRKVRLSILLNDDDINQFSGLNFEELIKEGGSVYLYDFNDDTMHQKFCVIDELVVIVGSYNWTKKAANRNTENVIIFDDDDETASKFKNQFYELIGKSKKFKKREKFNTPQDLLIKDFTPIISKIYEEKKGILFEDVKSEVYANPDLIPFRVGKKWGYYD